VWSFLLVNYVLSIGEKMAQLILLVKKWHNCMILIPVVANILVDGFLCREICEAAWFLGCGMIVVKKRRKSGGLVDGQKMIHQTIFPIFSTVPFSYIFYFSFKNKDLEEEYI